MSYEEATVDLCPGDVLLAYTDGVTEAHNPDERRVRRGEAEGVARARSPTCQRTTSAHASRPS